MVNDIAVKSNSQQEPYTVEELQATIGGSSNNNNNNNSSSSSNNNSSSSSSSGSGGDGNGIRNGNGNGNGKGGDTGGGGGGRCASFCGQAKEVLRRIYSGKSRKTAINLQIVWFSLSFGTYGLYVNRLF